MVSAAVEWTLSNFLFVRFTEDEKAADRVEFVPYVGDGVASSLQDRMLAEVRAKRIILAEHLIVTCDEYEQSWGNGATFGCSLCHEFDGITKAKGYCRTLRALALPYADHPDYQEGWRP